MSDRLGKPRLTHGQLYVAASCVGDTEHLHLAENKSVIRKTINVTYGDIL